MALQTSTLIDLTQEIVSKHHQYLRRAMPQITAWIRRLPRNSTTAKLDSVFGAMRDELETHMNKEEMVLFPFIERIERAHFSNVRLPVPPFGSVGNPIRMMEYEHDSALNALAEIRHITRDFTLPPDSVDPMPALYDELRELDEDLREHIRLENDILFPRALELERGA